MSGFVYLNKFLMFSIFLNEMRGKSCQKRGRKVCRVKEDRVHYLTECGTVNLLGGASSDCQEVLTT